MRQEYGISGAEFDTPKEAKDLPKEHVLASDEVSKPAREHQLPEQFGSSMSAPDTGSGKKEQHKKHKKTLRKMVYALASTAMVVTLAQTAEMDENMPTLSAECVGSLDITETHYSKNTYTFDIYDDGTIRVWKQGTDSPLQWARTSVNSACIDDENEKEAYEFVENISFDGSTNTLTFNDFDAEGKSLYLGWMKEKEPLTICFEGDNRVRYCYISGDNFNIEGHGSIGLGWTGSTYQMGVVQFEKAGYENETFEDKTNPNAVPQVRVADSVKFSNKEYRVAIKYNSIENVDVASILENPGTRWHYNTWNNAQEVVVQMQYENFKHIVEALTLGGNNLSEGAEVQETITSGEEADHESITSTDNSIDDIEAAESYHFDIEIATSGRTGAAKIAEEDAEAIKKALGYDQFAGNVIVVNENTSAWIDWENTSVPYDNVYLTEIFMPKLSRDADDKLVIGAVEKDEDSIVGSGVKDAVGVIGWYGSKTDYWAGGEGYFFDIRDKEYYEYEEFHESINAHMGMDYLWGFDEDGGMKQIPITDAYVIRIYYTVDGKGNAFVSPDREDGSYSYEWVDYWFLPENLLDTTSIKLEDMKP